MSKKPYLIRLAHFHVPAGVAAKLTVVAHLPIVPIEPSWTFHDVPWLVRRVVR